MQFSYLDCHMIITHFSPRELYFLRQTNKLYNELITNDVITKVIIKYIYLRLHKLIGEKYNEFIQLIEKYEMILYGKFILQCILDEYWTDFNINITMDMSNFQKKGNLFAEYKKIDDKVISDPIINYNYAIKYLYFSNDEILLNDYQEITHNQILLDFEMDLQDREIDIFMNSFSIVNGNIELSIKNIKKIMYKKENFELCPKDNFGIIQTNCIESLEKYGFTCNVNIYNQSRIDGTATDLVIYRETHEDFIFYGKHFKTLESGRIACNPIKITNNNYKLLYINIKLPDFKKTCSHSYCSVCETMRFFHAHSCKYVIFNNGQQQIGNIIIIKYDDVPEFIYHKEKFNDDYFDFETDSLDIPTKDSYSLPYPNKLHSYFEIDYESYFQDSLDGYNENYNIT